MKNALLLLLFLFAAACAPESEPVREAELWHDTDGTIYCPAADEMVLQADVDPADEVVIARCYWSCATYEPLGLTDPGALVLILYDAATAPWLPQDLQIFGVQSEHCD